jgi:hypothetical protein
VCPEHGADPPDVLPEPELIVKLNAKYNVQFKI